MAHPQHETLRQLFLFRCGYCGTSEQQAGGELTVDHFRPLSAQGSDDDEATQLAYQTLLEEMIVRQRELIHLYEERLRLLEGNQ